MERVKCKYTKIIFIKGLVLLMLFNPGLVNDLLIDKSVKIGKIYLINIDFIDQSVKIDDTSKKCLDFID